jgi:hypothetical protein
MSVCEDGIVHFVLDFAAVSVNRKNFFRSRKSKFQLRLQPPAPDSFVRYLENYRAFLDLSNKIKIVTIYKNFQQP